MTDASLILLEVGAKVTIPYQMYAATVTVKEGGETKAEPKKEEKKETQK